MSKTKSESSVTLRGEGSPKSPRRPGHRPISLPNRSRSVFIRLHPTHRGTPTMHKRFAPTPDTETPSHSSADDHMVKQSDSLPKDVHILEDHSDTQSGSSSPIFNRWTTQPQPHFGRRSSFLYQDMDGSDDHSTGGASYKGGEDYITPFAQILSSLHHVRADYLSLMGLPTDTTTAYSKDSWFQTQHGGNVEQYKDQHVDRHTMIRDILEKLDWCLCGFEKVSATKSMGDLAGEQFKQKMQRELSVLSEDKKGAKVAEWVAGITSCEPDKAWDSISLAHDDCTSGYESSLSVSLTHDNWIRHKNLQAPSRRVTVEAETIPTYGVECAAMNKDEMKKYMNSKLFSWDVDAFHLNLVSGGNPLVSSAYILFKQRNLFSEFEISPHVFINFMTAIQNQYHSVNPYHNAIHATDVLITTNILLGADNLDGVFSSLEIMSALVAAAVHDVDHPGVTNQFLVAIRHDLAILYNDFSVLENHHLATAFKTLQIKEPKCNFLENLSQDRVQLFRKVVIDMVLSTDMAKHFENVADMKTLIETKKLTNDGLLSLESYTETAAVLKCLIHCADLSNPTKPPAVASKWSYRVLEESFRQGAREKELGIPVHSMGDKDKISIPKCQVSFIDFVVYPLWETWAELVYPNAQHVLDNIADTRSYWSNLAEGEGEDLQEPADGENSRRSSSDTKRKTGDSCNCQSSDLKEDSVTSSSSATFQIGSRTASPVIRASSLSGMPTSTVGGEAPSSGVGVVSSSSGGVAGGKVEPLSMSADSATLRASFENSPAVERRTSWKAMKNMPIGQGISSSIQDSGEVHL